MEERIEGIGGGGREMVMGVRRKEGSGGGGRERVVRGWTKEGNRGKKGGLEGEGRRW